MELSDFLSHFDKVEQHGNEYIACCPNPDHNDHRPSLSIRLSEDGSKILIHCFAGCSDKDILDAVGLKMSDLFIDKRDKPPDAKSKTQYSYYDMDGKLLVSVK